MRYISGTGDAALTSTSPFESNDAPTTYEVQDVPEAAPPSTSLRVLVVDDDVQIREMLEFLLAAEDFDVAVATNGAEALETLESQPADVVLLDVMMPELSGFQVIERLRAQETSPSIIFVTAKADDKDVWEGWCRGADSYITKPIDIDILLGEIARVTEGRGAA